MALKITSSITGILAVVAISGFDRAQSAEGAAATQTAPPTVAVATGLKPITEGGSPYFSRVMGRLDVGGKTLRYEDDEGHREMFIALATGLMEALPKELTGGKIDVEGLVDACGLGQAAASGSSLRKDGAFWLSRSYTYLPGQNHGFYDLLGAPAREFKSPGRLPASTDVVVEIQLDATTLAGKAEAIAKALGREEDVRTVLEEPAPSGTTLREFLAKTKLHLTVGIDISALKANAAKAQPIDFFLQIDGARELLPDLLPEVEKGLGKATAFGERDGWELPMEAGFLHPTALLLYDDQGTVTFVSRESYLQQIDSNAAKLASVKEFATATANFPKAGNLLVFASSRVPVAVASTIRQMSPKEFDADAAPFVTKFAQWIEPRPWSACVACEPDGIATTCELPYPLDSSMTSVAPLLAMESTLFIGARAWKKGSDRAGCMLNIRNVQQAIRSYQNINNLKEGDPIPWDEIIGENGFMPTKPTCPQGGTYTFATKMPKVGDLACKCSIHDHEPANHQDW